MGSPCGKEFLQTRLDIIELFYNQCSGQQLIVPTNQDAETVTTKQDAETMTTKQDAETMTENTDIPPLTNRSVQPKSANQNKHLKQNASADNSKPFGDRTIRDFQSISNVDNSKPFGDKTIRDIQSVSNVNNGKPFGDKTIRDIQSVSNVDNGKPFGDKTIRDIQSVSNVDNGKPFGDKTIRDIQSVSNVDNGKPFGDKTIRDIQSVSNVDNGKPFGDKTIRDFQSISNESFESVNDLFSQDKNLGDSFYNEYNGDENSDSDSVLKDIDNTNIKSQYFLENSKILETNLSDGSGPREGRLRRKPKLKSAVDGLYQYYGYKIPPKNKDKKNIAERRTKLKALKALQVPACEEGKMFDIYVSGKEILHSVKELKDCELHTGVSHIETEGSEANQSYHIKSEVTGIGSVKSEEPVLVVLGAAESGYYINLEDIQEQDVKPIRSEETTKKPAIEYKNVDIKKRSDGRFICPKCGKDYKCKFSAVLHVRVEHFHQSPFKCYVCGKLFRSSFELRRHTLWHFRKKHIVDPPLICTICIDTFPSKQHLDDHMKTHNLPQFICEHCGKSFMYKNLLKSHRRVHDTEGVVPSFRCPDPCCGALFKSQLRLDKHLEYKRAGLDFICDKCGFKAKRKQDLDRHLERKHSENRKPEYFCQQCNKYFFTKRNYITHIENHQGVARYVCDCCNRAFASSSTLKRHYLRQAGLYVRPKSKKNKIEVY